MSQNNGSAIYLNEPLGTLVESVDYNNQQVAIVQNIGGGIVAQQGTLYARSNYQGLAVTTNGTMSISIGGSNQRVLCDGYWCDGCPLDTFTVPTAPSSGTRIDAICIQSNPLGTQTGTISRDSKNSEGVVTEVNVPQVVSGVNYQYVEGDTSGSPPTPPAGYTRFILISIPTGTSAINAGNCSYDSGYPLMNSQGPTGPSPLAETTAVVTIPVVGLSVTVPVGNGQAYPNGMYVIVSDGIHAFYGEVTAGGTTDALTVECLAILLSTAGQVIASGSPVAFAGSPGATGAQGPVGAQGIQGNPGANGSNGLSPNPRGNWDASTNYNTLDIVQYNGAGYIAVVPSLGVEPDTDGGSHWMIFAAKGAQGVPGQNGQNGSPGPQGPTGAPGQNGTNGQNAYTLTTQSIEIPAVGSGVSVPVENANPLPFGAFCLISDGQNSFYGQVTSNSGSPVAIKNLFIVANVGNTINAGAMVVSCGAPSNAALNAQGLSFYAITGITDVNGGLALDGVLPGPPGQLYKIKAQAICLLHDSNSWLTLTGGGAGVNWTPGSNTTSNGIGDRAISTIWGTAAAGTLPSVSWSINDSIDGLGSGNHVDILAIGL